MVELKISLRCSQPARKKTVYILNLISSFTGLKFTLTDDKADIIYGEADNEKALVIPFRELMAKSSIDSPVDWQHTDSKFKVMLPAYIANESININNSRLSFDLFQLMFRFLTTGLTNQKNPTWLSQNNAVCVYPVFDSYVEYFIQALKDLNKISQGFQRISPWPNGAKFALGLSHDIDIFKRKVAGSLVMLAKSIYTDEIPGGIKGSITGLADSLKAAVSGGLNPYMMIDKWFSIEGSATFFVFAGDRRSSKDPTYKPDDVYKVLTDCKSGKYEIGLHNGLGTWADKNELNELRNRLAELFGSEIHGLRPHYLDCRYPDFWRNAESYEYSSSVGSDTIAGFTGGINFPFFGFDFETGDAFDILEIPIGLMDGALFSEKDKSTREKIVETIIESCIANHGLLVLDWHTRTAYEPDFPGWLKTYCSILEKAKAAGAYLAPLNEINNRWRNHCASVFLS